MPKLQVFSTIPDKVVVACSGGADSMALLDYVSRPSRRRASMDIVAVHVNHGTTHSAEAEALVREYCTRRAIPLSVHSYQHKEKPTEADWSAFRRQVYSMFSDRCVLTAHTLDDAMAWWISSSLRGSPRLIPISSGNVFRPFLLTTKAVIRNHAQRSFLKWVEDPTNHDGSNERGRMLSEVLPLLSTVHPGFRTTIRNMYLQLLAGGHPAEVEDSE